MVGYNKNKVLLLLPQCLVEWWNPGMRAILTIGVSVIACLFLSPHYVQPFGQKRGCWKRWHRRFAATTCDPANSLAKGEWVKLICGASNQDVASVRNLCHIYTMVGVDCVDLAADPAVVAAAHEGITAAIQHTTRAKPHIMISVNDDEDPHFRKAHFNPELCPVDCPRPCERVCPAAAIPTVHHPVTTVGVIENQCYGCGRCVPVCPLGLIDTKSFVADRVAVSRLLQSGQVDALEIHTSAGHEFEFANLWDNLGDTAKLLKVLSVSFPNMGNKTMPFLLTLQSIFTHHSSWQDFTGVQVWQADGRPMSGDIGKGTAHAAAALAAQLLLPHTAGSDSGVPKCHGDDESNDKQVNFHSGKHYIQLAGGTNDYSATTARQQGILGERGFGGFAFGGYARKQIGLHLNRLESVAPGAKIEDHPACLATCLEIANKLIRTVKN